MMMQEGKGVRGIKISINFTTANSYVTYVNLKQTVIFEPNPIK